MSERPTEAQCHAEFWAILGPALADAIREGRIDPADYPVA